MPSKKSKSSGGTNPWFSKAMFLQSMNTFAPIPIIYGMLLFLAGPMDIFLWEIDLAVDTGIYSQLSEYSNYAIRLGLPIAFLTGCLSAMMVFRYLCNNRSSNMVHSLPITREALFITQYFTGLLFVLLPNLIILILTLLACAVHGIFYATPFLYIFFIHCGLYFFFYSFAVLCAMLTGSVGAVAIFYLVLNFVVAFVTLMLQPLFEIYYLGYAGSTFDYPFVQLLTPLYSLTFAAWVDVDIAITNYNSLEPGGLFHLLPENLFYEIRELPVFLAYLLVGLVFVVISLFVYKYRHIESAGEAVAVPQLKPVFRFGISVLGGISMGLVTIVVLSGSIYLAEMKIILSFGSLIWGIIFCLVAEMILQKSFRVLKYWKTALIPVGTIAVIYLVLTFDLGGFVHRVPELAEVESIQFSTDSIFPKDSASYIATVREEDGTLNADYMELVQEIHRLAVPNSAEYVLRLENLTDDFDVVDKLRLNYELYSGYDVTREYLLGYYLTDLEEENSFASALLGFYEEKSRLKSKYQFDQMEGNIQAITFSNTYDSQSDSFKTDAITQLNPELSTNQVKEAEEALVRAMLKDLEEGNLGRRYLSYEQDDYISDSMSFKIEISWREEVVDNRRTELQQQGELEVNYKGEPSSGTLTTLADSREEANFRVKSTYVVLNKDCVHSLEALKEYEILGERVVYSNMEYLEQMVRWFEAGGSHWHKVRGVPTSELDPRIDYNDPMSYVGALNQ